VGIAHFVCLDMPLYLFLTSHFVCRYSCVSFGYISFIVRGRLSSKTCSEYHFAPKATMLKRIGMTSWPFLVRTHLTSRGLSFKMTAWIIPHSSNSCNRMIRTRGVKPGRDRRSSLNLSILKKAILRRIRTVHFFPKKFIATFTGQSLNFIDGNWIAFSSSLWDVSDIVYSTYLAILYGISSILLILSILREK
jgi:hypothetical protein